MEKKFGSAAAWTAGVAAAVALAACGGGGGGGGSAEMGTVSMSMIDASCGYKNVWVNVKEVRIQKSPTAAETDAGWTSLVPAGGSRRIDLLNLTNGTFVDLGAATVEAGTYSQLRLVLEDTGNEVVLDSGATEQLKTPSAQQSGLKIKTDYSVAPNTTSTFVLDFDACKSIVVAGNGKYILKPVVRLTPTYAGAIVGYATAGANVSAQTTAGEIERNTVADSTGKFVLPYVMPGTYTVVITKDAFSTAVVTSVPVGTSTTTLNTSTSSFALTASTMGTVTGTVTGAASAAGVTDASVAATQTLTGGPTIQVKETNVDASTGGYTLSLPVSPPKRAVYSTTLITLTEDTTVGSAYTLKASSPGETTLTSPVTVNATTPQVRNFAFP